METGGAWARGNTLKSEQTVTNLIFVKLIIMIYLVSKLWKTFKMLNVNFLVNIQ
jgi:hypothetical protein